MTLPIKARILADKSLDDQDPQPIELPAYPDTGETGDTYEVEFDAKPDPADEEAMEKAREFLREQSEQSLRAKQ